jgi:hypothetical protein
MDLWGCLITDSTKTTATGQRRKLLRRARH